MTDGISRREVNKVAWTAPAIFIGAPAPACAASPALAVSNHGLLTQNGSTLKVDGTTRSGQSNPGLVWTGPVSSISEVSVTFWFPTATLTFSSGVSGWSALQATGVKQVVNGTTHYAYTATYTANSGSVPVTNQKTVLSYSFTALNASSTMRSFIADSSSLVNGMPWTTSSGVQAVSTMMVAPAAKSESTTSSAVTLSF